MRLDVGIVFGLVVQAVSYKNNRPPVADDRHLPIGHFPTTTGTRYKMKKPARLRLAGCVTRIGHFSNYFPGDWRQVALTVGKVGALSDLDNITVRIADVAADLAVLGDRLCDELGSSAFP